MNRPDQYSDVWAEVMWRRLLPLPLPLLLGDVEGRRPPWPKPPPGRVGSGAEVGEVPGGLLWTRLELLTIVNADRDNDRLSSCSILPVRVRGPTAMPDVEEAVLALVFGGAGMLPPS